MKWYHKFLLGLFISVVTFIIGIMCVFAFAPEPADHYYYGRDINTGYIQYIILTDKQLEKSRINGDTVYYDSNIYVITRKIK